MLPRFKRMTVSSKLLFAFGVGAISLLVAYVFFFRGFEIGSPIGQTLRTEPRVDIRQILAASLQAVEHAGKKVVSIRESGQLDTRSKGTLQQGVNDPVTEADMQSHITLMSHLKPLFPNVELISEEHDSRELPSPEIPINLGYLDEDLPVSGMVKPSDVQVWLDPLDATKEYSEGLTQYVTVLACVAVRGVPVAGVVHYPFEKYSMWAWKGRGLSFRPAEAPAADAPWKVIVSRSHAGDIKDNAGALGVSDDGVTPAGGAGFKVGEVLAGRQDAYLHKTRIKKWDLCAGHALLNAAGGSMTDWRGRDIDYSDSSKPYVRGGVVAALHRHGEMVTKLSKLDIDAVERANAASASNK